MAKKIKLRARNLTRSLRWVAAFLFKSKLLQVFLVLCVLGAFVGAQTRPDPHVVPYDELFGQMSVVSYRESPSDTTARFLVELSGGGKVFRRYDVDAKIFLPPAPDRDYNRAITGTFYRPLRVRGHVAQGLWLDVPRHSSPSLLSEQFDELYRVTLGFMKPASMVAGVIGTLSGYSVGYRLGIWNSTLSSRMVQERVLGTPELGRVIAREAWRRVLLEPVVMGGEDDAMRFAAIRGTQRLYAAFFRIALNDSDGFIPREAERLAHLGHVEASQAMLDFTAAVRRAAADVPVTSADFSAVERWASLLVRRGHWAYNAIPPAGEERSRYLGMLAWYGVAPPTSEVDRVWVGPRLLVREGETEGFVADEIPATGVGCPIAWRSWLREERTGPNAKARAWLSDHPEFTALAGLASHLAHDVATIAQQVAARRSAGATVSARGHGRAAVATALGGRTPATATPGPADSAGLRSIAYPFRSVGGPVSITLFTADSAGIVAIRDRRDTTRCFARIRLASRQAIATVGEYEQFVAADGRPPASGIQASAARPTQGLVSVTVLATSATTADSSSTALLALGTAEAKRWARERADLSAILIERGSDGIDTVWIESDLRERLALEGECARLRVEYY